MLQQPAKVYFPIRIDEAALDGDPRLYDELLKSVTDLQTLLMDVRENPKKYVPPVQVKVF